MATVWEEFGIAVAKARAARKWTLEALADVAFGNKERKGYVSQIEKGRTRLNTATIQKLAKALELPEAVTDPLYRSHLPDENKLDTDAKRLMSMASADAAAPTAAEPLMIALAYEFAQGSHIDLSTAYTGLRKALEAAAEMRAELARLHNMDARLAAVLQRVEDLNNQGLRDAAGEELDAAIKAKEAELEALQDTALKQDRLRNRPADAAARLIKRLKDSAPAGGLFSAIHRLSIETSERGAQQSDPFDLALALELAKANSERAKGPQISVALAALGNCHLALGERQAGGGHLTRARTAFAEVLRLTSRQRDPLNWAGSKNNLGNALAILGDRTADPALLEQAVVAHRAALTVRTPETTPEDWAASQNNLGNTLQCLGERTADPTFLEQAVAAHRAALTVRTREMSPMDWATSQNNLGAALQYLSERTADPALLEQAVAAHRAALTVYTPETTPMDWAGAQHNLAIAFLALHKTSGKVDWLEKAEVAFANALTVRLRDKAEYNWADSYGGTGKVYLARFVLTGDRTHLDHARGILMEARAVYALDPTNATLKDFDQLLAQIDAL